MLNLINNNNIIGNEPMGGKGTLGWRNNISQYFSQPVSQDFENQLIDDVAQTNRMKVTGLSGMDHLRNQDNVSVVDPRTKMSVIKKG